MITKQVHNSGATSCHGMSTIDVARQLIEQKYKDECAIKGNAVHCGCGHDFILTGDEESKVMTLQELTQIDLVINNTKQCPFCKHGLFSPKRPNERKMREVFFEVDGKKLEAIYKPRGYKFLPVEEVDGE